MKLFCFDIDGTLIPFGEKEIPEEELKALQALLDAGHAVALASGRPFCSLKHHLSPLRGNAKFYICANGASVYDDDGNTIEETALASSDLVYVRSKYEKGSIGVYAYEGKGNIVCFSRDKWILEEEDYNRIPLEDITILEEGKPIIGHDHLLKIMIAGEKEDMVHFELDEEDKAKYEYSRSAPTYLELLQKGSTKGERVEDLRKHLGINSEDVYCFGDQNNDLSMVSRFNGIAMGNAIEELKSAAKYITSDDHHHGVVYALREILKII